MKRSIKAMLMAAAATLMFASCSEEVQVEVNNGRPIDFRSAITSRYLPVTNANLNEICVTALLIDKDEKDQEYFKSVYFGGGEKNGTLSELFTKQEPTEPGAQVYFKSTTNIYWPADKAYLQFYAFAPTRDENGNTLFTGATINEKLQAINFDPEDVIANQVDLVTAEAKQNRVGGEATGVQLDFKHQLAQIEIRACANHPLYDFYVSGVRIGRVAARGTFKFSDKTWELGSFKFVDNGWTYDGSDRSTYSYVNTVDGLGETPIWTKLVPAVEGQEAECFMPTKTVTEDGKEVVKILNAFLLPQKLTPWNRENDFNTNSNTGEKDNEGAYIALKLRVVEKGTEKEVYPNPWGSQYEWAATPIKGEWKAGKKYVYTLNLNKGAGFVDPTEPQPGTPILHDPIEFKVTVSDFEGNKDPETPTDLEWDNGGKPATGSN